MKKICFYINSDWYFNLHWLDRATAGINEGYEIHVICNFESKEIINKFRSLGIITHNSKMSEQSLNPLIIIKDILKSIKLINAINPDILHCITIKPCLIGGCYAKLRKKNLVLSFVGLGRVFSSDEKKYLFLKNMVAPLYRWITAKKDVFLIFEHEKDRSRIIQMTGVRQDKTIVIEGAGIDVKDFDYVKEEIRPTPIVLFASRLIWSKGLADLVEVKKNLEAKNVFFELNVAGISVKNDPDCIPDNIIEQWSAENKINWLGKSNNVKELIEMSNIVALPSVYAEGVPRILIEAAAVGRASIAYDTGGCTSIIENNLTGFIVPKNDIAQLSEKIEELLTNSRLREELGLRARERVTNLFSSTSVIEKTLLIYKSLG